MSRNLYTTKEAANLLGVTPARVRQMVARGEVESEKLGRDRFITAEAIETARQRKTSPGPMARPPGKVSTANKAATGAATARNGTPTPKAKKKGSKR
jgi:excisionase family DNA binding protein